MYLVRQGVFPLFRALPFNPSFKALSQHHPFYNPSLSRLLLLLFFFYFSHLFLRFSLQVSLLSSAALCYFFLYLHPSVHKSLWIPPLLCYRSLFLPADSFFWHNSAASFTHFYQIIVFSPLPLCHSSLSASILPHPPPIFYLSLYATSFPSFVSFWGLLCCVRICASIYACVWLVVRLSYIKAAYWEN